MSEILLACEDRGYRGRNFGCAAAKKGEAICTNKAQISELKLTGAVAGALHEVMEQPRFFEPVFKRFQATFARLLAEVNRPTTEPATRELDAAVTRQRGEVEKAADILFQVGGVSDTLKARLQEAESKLKALEARRAALRTPTPHAKLPAPPTSSRRCSRKCWKPWPVTPNAGTWRSGPGWPPSS